MLINQAITNQFRPNNINFGRNAEARTITTNNPINQTTGLLIIVYAPFYEISFIYLKSD
jgi:hypothetical protein